MSKTVRIEKKSFAAAREQAVKTNQASFKYKDVLFDTGFSKYLIEAMDRLKKESIGVTHSESISHG